MSRIQNVDKYSNSINRFLFTSPLECGIINKKTRIVGGQQTYVNQYPWMALLMYKNRFYCGATLINNLYVMTAAHCVQLSISKSSQALKTKI